MYFAIGSIPEHDLREIILIVQFGVYLIQFYLLIFFINNHFLYKKTMTFLLQPRIYDMFLVNRGQVDQLKGALPPPFNFPQMSLYLQHDRDHLCIYDIQLIVSITQHHM